jgi:pectate lyase
MSNASRIECWGQFITVVAIILSQSVMLAAHNKNTVTIQPTVQTTGIKAFPTAEGFGSATPGGRGGRVIYVTNLNDRGTGSLRAALEATGPRFVLFKVSGTIELSSNIQVSEENSFVTVAGQTAPGDGIQLKNWTIDLRSGVHDVVIRHLRFRPGTGGVKIDPSRGVLNGNQIDGFLVYGNTSQVVHNVVVDHCSIQWAVDENGEVWGNATDVTYQWCIMAEGAMWGHEKGPHSMGMIMGGWGGKHQMRVSVHHSLFAHNLGRSPLMNRVSPEKPDVCLLDFRNNVIYNWGGAQGATELGAVMPGGAPFDMNFGTVLKANIINNVYWPGPDTGGWFSLNGGIAHVKGPVKVYLEGNYGPKCESGCGVAHRNIALVDLMDISNIKFASHATYGSDTAFKVATVRTTPTKNVVKTVLANVGASKPKRDAVDARIVDETTKRTGKLGPYDGVEKLPLSRYPILKSTAPPADSDNDGIPDVWEIANGLDANNLADGGKIAKNGYTNIENYINELAGDECFTASLAE